MKATEEDRRSFWIEQSEQACDFMMKKILPYPVVESNEPFVSLREASAQAKVTVLFSDQKHVNNLDRLFYLRKGQIPGFLEAAKEMNLRGWAIRVEDGFRTREMQKYLGREPKVFDAILQKVIWELNGKTPEPELMFQRCTGLVATVPKFATHMSGSAIDISVMLLGDVTVEVDRGGPYIEMSERTPMKSPYISSGAQKNRDEIATIMLKHGFVAYPWEFWHFSSGDAYDQYLSNTGKPAIYGPVNWNSMTNEIEPMPNPTEPLNSEFEIRTEIEAALKRLGR